MSFTEVNDYDNVDVVGNDAFEMAAAPYKQVAARKRLDEILIETGVSMEDFKLIKGGSRKRHLIKYKVLYIKEALKYNYTYKRLQIILEFLMLPHTNCLRNMAFRGLY